MNIDSLVGVHISYGRCLARAPTDATNLTDEDRHVQQEKILLDKEEYLHHSDFYSCLGSLCCAYVRAGQRAHAIR